MRIEYASCQRRLRREVPPISHLKEIRTLVRAVDAGSVERLTHLPLHKILRTTQRVSPRLRGMPSLWRAATSMLYSDVSDSENKWIRASRLSHIIRWRKKSLLG